MVLLRLLSYPHHSPQSGTGLVQLDLHTSIVTISSTIRLTHHAALPVDSQQAGAALQLDHPRLEVVPGDLEAEAKHRGEGVVVLLADLLRSEIIISGLRGLRL